MRFLPTDRTVRFFVAALLLTAGGCASTANSSDGDGLKLADPSPAFRKKVERDPFPRAGAAAGTAG